MTEDRIARDADQRLQSACRRHAFEKHAVDAGIRPVRADGVVDAVPGGLQFRFIAHANDHASRIGLVQDLRTDDLGHQWVAHLARHLASLVQCRGDATCGNRNACRAQHGFAVRLRQRPEDRACTRPARGLQQGREAGVEAGLPLAICHPALDRLDRLADAPDWRKPGLGEHLVGAALAFTHPDRQHGDRTLRLHLGGDRRAECRDIAVLERLRQQHERHIGIAADRLQARAHQFRVGQHSRRGVNGIVDGGIRRQRGAQQGSRLRGELGQLQSGAADHVRTQRSRAARTGVDRQCSAGPWHAAGKQPCGVDQFIDVIDFDHAELREYRAIDFRRPGDGCRMRLRRLAPILRPPHFQGDDGLALARGMLDSSSKLATVMDTFQQRSDDLDVRCVGHVVNKVTHLQVDLIAAGAPECNADTAVHRLQYIAAEAATLGRQPHGAAPQVVPEGRGEGEAELLGDIGQARAVRAIDAHTGALHDVLHGLLGGLSFVARLAEARSQDDGEAHAFLATLLQDRQDMLGRHRHHRRIGGSWQRSHVRPGLAPGDLRLRRIDEIHVAAKVGMFEQVFKRPGADAAGAIAGTDQCDRAGADEQRQVLVCLHDFSS
ncbi:hypothetical protein D9M68_444230 [compost metagenome]